MGKKQGRAIGGSLIGGLIGGFGGLCVGGLLGPVLAGIERHPDESLLGLFDTCLGFIAMLIGAAIGGVVGAVGGAAFGAGLATSDSRQRPSGGALPNEESVESELRRLKSRIAELEGEEDPEASERPPSDIE